MSFSKSVFEGSIHPGGHTIFAVSQLYKYPYFATLTRSLSYAQQFCPASKARFSAIQIWLPILTVL